MMNERILDEASGNDLHLWNYVGVIRQRLPLVVGVFLIVTILTALYAWTRTPRYTATSRLLIGSRGVNLTSMQDAFDPGRVNIAQRDLIQTQVQLITSTPVMEAVLQMGFLAASPDFAEARDPVRTLAKLVKVAPASSGYVVDVSIEREDPIEAAKIVNAVVEAYQADGRKRRMGVSDEGIAELKKKAESLRTRLDVETAALQAFMVSNKMVSFEDAQNIVVERLKGLNKNLMLAEPQRIQAESRYLSAKKMLESGVAVESIPGVLESPLIANLKMELSKQEQQYSELRNRMGDNHPQVQSVVAQMQTLRTKLAMEANNIVAGMRGRYEQALNEEKMLREELASQEEEVLRFNELASHYNLLRQSRDSIQTAYNTVIHRIDELDVSQLSGQGDNVFVVSRAEVPQIKSWPSRSKMLLLGIVLGMLAGIGAAFFLDYMDTSIKSETDIHNLLKLSVLGGIPAADDADDEKGFDDFFACRCPRSLFAEAFRSARTALSFSTDNKPLQTFVVTSTMPAEGKTLVALNLAIAYAQTGKRTLLVDTDLRKSRLHTLFPGAVQENSVTRLLAKDYNDAELTAAVFQSKIPNLYFLPSGKLPQNPVELLDSKRFIQLVQDLRKHYDIVIFDAPPALNLVDALIIGRQTDGVLVVARTYVTNKYAARQMVRQIIASGVKALGILLNNIDTPSGSYYGGYGNYGSYGGYGHYYGDDSSDPSSTTSTANGWLTRLRNLGRHRTS